ncbi:hypothetical protein QAD02_013669 [Eretmocerus hayati]|uniref:Uncharacterized protein n=2 Tax=Eretmocerus hayati TaxID=131215 RepID=A0ACC2P3E1_9HYME|nr:hypothetical protein QAD02_013666 [Eretmocerus hayati]KAJ8677882.1 hypothetical protein QAD02_013669 [Eretmocerus hayati]
MSATKKYVFQTFEFTDSVNPDGKEDIDAAPSIWIKYDFQRASCVVPYPDFPYTKETIADLRRRVQAIDKPKQSWPRWPIKLRGGANTYKKAVDRVNALKQEDYAFTTDNESEFEAKAIQQTELFRQEAYKHVMAVKRSERSEDSDAVRSSSASENQDAEGELSNLDSAPPTPKKRKILKNGSCEKGEQQKVLEESGADDSHANLQLSTTVEKRKNGDNTNAQAHCSKDSIPIPTGAQSEKSVSNVQSQLRDEKKNDQGEVKVNSGDISILIRDLASLKVSFGELAGDVKAMRQSLDGGDVTEFKKKLKEMDLTLPLKDESSWNNFDDELLQNDGFNSIFVKTIRTLYDGLGNKPTKSCTNISKMVFTKKLLKERFNPFRSDEKKDKIAFSDSAMYSVMIGGSDLGNNRMNTWKTSTSMERIKNERRNYPRRKRKLAKKKNQAKIITPTSYSDSEPEDHSGERNGERHDHEPTINVCNESSLDCVDDDLNNEELPFEDERFEIEHVFEYNANLCADISEESLLKQSAIDNNILYKSIDRLLLILRRRLLPNLP